MLFWMTKMISKITQNEINNKTVFTGTNKTVLYCFEHDLEILSSIIPTDLGNGKDFELVKVESTHYLYSQIDGKLKLKVWFDENII